MAPLTWAIPPGDTIIKTAGTVVWALFDFFGLPETIDLLQHFHGQIKGGLLFQEEFHVIAPFGIKNHFCQVTWTLHNGDLAFGVMNFESAVGSIHTISPLYQKDSINLSGAAPNDFRWL
jgi:hypothetical protein